jgi:hypothetical protein
LVITSYFIISPEIKLIIKWLYNRDLNSGHPKFGNIQISEKFVSGFHPVFMATILPLPEHQTQLTEFKITVLGIELKYWSAIFEIWNFAKNFYIFLGYFGWVVLSPENLKVTFCYLNKKLYLYISILTQIY